MDQLLSKVKDIFKIDKSTALIDLEVYMTKLMQRQQQEEI
jgi:hypothetical protein